MIRANGSKKKIQINTYMKKELAVSIWMETERVRMITVKTCKILVACLNWH